MKEGIQQSEFQSMFDATVKKYLVAGQSPEDALGNACRELSITLPANVEQNIINSLKLALAQSPHMLAKQKILARKIRELMREGKRTAEAVKEAQSQTNIRLGEEGERALIQVLEAERERVSELRVEVVSAEEFSAMQGEKCIAYHLNGKDGWACCKCSEHNRKNQDSCVMCGHARCDRFNQ